MTASLSDLTADLALQEVLAESRARLKAIAALVALSRPKPVTEKTEAKGARSNEA